MSMHRNLDLPRPHVVVAAHPSKNGYETRRAACGRYGQDVLRARTHPRDPLRHVPAPAGSRGGAPGGSPVMRAWLLAEADPAEIQVVVQGMKWVITGLVFLLAFYGGLDPVSLDAWLD